MYSHVELHLLDCIPPFPSCKLYLADAYLDVWWVIHRYTYNWTSVSLSILKDVSIFIWVHAVCGSDAWSTYCVWASTSTLFMFLYSLGTEKFGENYEDDQINGLQDFPVNSMFFMAKICTRETPSRITFLSWPIRVDTYR